MVQKKKILVVDDEESLVKLIKYRLEFNGYAVVTAGDGRDAVEKFKAESPDLIILDIMMPELDGYETAKEIRSEEELRGAKRTPIIMLTARTKAFEGQMGYAAGANLYIKKPFNSEELIAIVGKALGN